MRIGVLLLALSGFLTMAILPAVFFRRGRPTPGWLATAAPFALDALVVAAGIAGIVRPAFGTPVLRVLAVLAVPALIAGLGLILWTVRTHRARPALWHQPDDEPPVLVTWGPYARVRHPFYTAFALLLLGTALALPHAVTGAMLIVGVAQLARTAEREEARLAASSVFGEAYGRYARRTGRLVPRW